MRRRRKPLWKKVRIPLPSQRGGPHTGPKGKKGYDREKAKKEARKQIEESQLGEE